MGDKKEKWMTKGEKDKKRRKQLKKMKKALEKKIAKEQEALRPKEIEEKLRDTKKSKAGENGNIVEKKSKKKDKKDKVPKPGTSSGSGSSEDKSSSSDGSENEDDIGASCDYIIDNLPKCKDPVQEGDRQRYLENALRPMHKKKNELSVKHYKSYSTTQHYKNVVKERNDFDSNDFELIEAKDCKENVCTFCNSGHTGDFIEHLNSAHKDEAEVKEFQDLSIKAAFSREWSEFLDGLEKRARFSFNQINLEKEKGKIIIEKLPDKQLLKANDINPKLSKVVKDINKFVPCPFCLGFYHEIEIPEHVHNQCFLAKKDKNFSKMRNFVREGQLLLPTKQGVPNGEALKLMESLGDDEIADVVKRDFYILKLGEYMLNKYKNFRSNQTMFCVSRMRVCGNLMLHLQKKGLATCSPGIQSEIGGIKSVICPEMFNELKEAAKDIARQDPSNPDRIIVNVSIKVGEAIKKVAEAIKMHCMRSRDNVMHSQKLIYRAERLTTLMQTDWLHIGSMRKKYDQENSSKRDEVLPLTSDVRNLVDGIKHELEETLASIAYHRTKKNVQKLQRVLLMRLVVFNMRRIGEVSRMRVQDFESSKRARQTREENEEFSSLSELEKAVSKTMLLVRFGGKVGRHVACLAPPDAVEGLEVLAQEKYRRTAGIIPENELIFATPGSMNHIQGVTCFKQFAQKYCEQPDRVRGTKMRKYIATSCQIIDLGPEGKDTLCDHLGHELNVHNAFYRKHSDLVELTKVAQVLCLAEAGKLSENAGRTLDNLDISEKLFEAEMMNGTFAKDKGDEEGGDSEIEEISGETLKGKYPCNECDGCSRNKPDDDCAKRKFCLDKPKFGGSNTIRRKCITKRCQFEPEFDKNKKQGGEDKDNDEDSDDPEALGDIKMDVKVKQEKHWSEYNEPLSKRIKTEPVEVESDDPNDSPSKRQKGNNGLAVESRQYLSAQPQAQPEKDQVEGEAANENTIDNEGCAPGFIWKTRPDGTKYQVRDYRKAKILPNGQLDNRIGMIDNRSGNPFWRSRWSGQSNCRSMGIISGTSHFRR